LHGRRRRRGSVQRGRKLAPVLADEVVVLLAGEGLEELEQGLAAAALGEEAVAAGDFEGRFESFAETALRCVGAR
jgi:hypothetical protein